MHQCPFDQFAKQTVQLERTLIASIHFPDKLKRGQPKHLCAPISTSNPWYLGVWNTIISVMALICAIITPLRLAFYMNATFQSSIQQLELAIDLVFILSAVAHMVHVIPADFEDYGLANDGHLTDTQFRTMILKHRLSHWWITIPHWIGVLPWDFIFQACSDQFSPEVVFFLGMLRMIRLWLLDYNVSRAGTNVNINYFVVRLTQFLVALAIECHWFAW